jgi:Tol biopolymer transport system component
VWLFDLNRRVLSRQTFEGNQVFAIWGPGPDQFTFSSDREGPWELYVKTVNSGPGQVEKLPIRLAGESHYAGSWSPEGETLVFSGAGEDGSSGIFTYTTGGQTEPFLNSRYDESHPEFSPDGRWLVYVSNESGSEEVFGCPYPGPGGRIQISRGGGSHPLWSRDGREILYRGGQSNQDFYSVRIKVEEDTLNPDEPIKVLNDAPYRFSGPIRSDDIAPDGRRLLIKYSSEAALSSTFEGFLPTNIQVVQGWLRELEENWSTDQLD